MDYKISEEKIQEFYEDMDEIEKFLNGRVQELLEVKGGQSERHAFIFYRRLLWDVKYLIRDNIEEIKSPTKKQTK